MTRVKNRTRRRPPKPRFRNVVAADLQRNPKSKIDNRKSAGSGFGSGKLWGGRFQGGTDASVEAFTASIDVDARLYRHDIAGSIAHERMRDRQRTTRAADGKKIVLGGKKSEEKIDRGDFSSPPAD